MRYWDGRLDPSAEAVDLVRERVRTVDDHQQQRWRELAKAHPEHLGHAKRAG
jgi:hypothetical protein